jgi:hypothetical protein
MKNFYYVVMEEIDGKNCAYVDKVSENTNICGRWEASQFIFVQPCESKKRAEELADFWNESYKTNGTYLFD